MRRVSSHSLESLRSFEATAEAVDLDGCGPYMVNTAAGPLNTCIDTLNQALSEYTREYNVYYNTPPSLSPPPPPQRSFLGSDAASLATVPQMTCAPSRPTRVMTFSVAVSATRMGRLRSGAEPSLSDGVT